VSALRLAAVMPELARIVNVVDYLADSYAEQEAECEKSSFMGHGKPHFLAKCTTAQIAPIPTTHIKAPIVHLLRTSSK
jgi:hypothetical protein